MKLSIIASLGEKNEIGQGNALLCHLPIDLNHFKSITKGHTIIMGRKTFESLPKGKLPYRRNIIISRNSQLKIIHSEVYPSLDIALKITENENEVFIIGGSQLYQQTISLVDVLYLTEIHACFPKADVFFPPFNIKEWKERNRKNFISDEKNLYSLSFVQYERILQVSPTNGRKNK